MTLEAVGTGLVMNVLVMNVLRQGVPTCTRKQLNSKRKRNDGVKNGRFFSVGIRCTSGDSDVILSTTVTVAMLEVCTIVCSVPLKLCIRSNLRLWPHVWNYVPVEILDMRIIWHKTFQFSHFASLKLSTGIPPIWWRGFVLSSMTSVRLMYCDVCDMVGSFLIAELFWTVADLQRFIVYGAVSKWFTDDPIWQLCCTVFGWNVVDTMLMQVATSRLAYVLRFVSFSVILLVLLFFD